jgi:very-short-patch-repair endonuclease
MKKSKYIDFKVIRKHIRQLRKDQTSSEQLLWSKLRNRRLEGYKFLRQHPIVYRADYKGLNYFIADFYCDEKKVVLELDGSVHEENQEHDKFRDSEMKAMGIIVLRIKNEELYNLTGVMQKISSFLNSIS